jgi:Outer membrane protein beta-barrel domain
MKLVITPTRLSLLSVGIIIFALCRPNYASAQGIVDNLELNAGYTHITGDLGLNGFTFGGGLWLNRRVSLNLDYDTAYKTSSLDVLSLTSVGSTSIANHLQDWLIGPRIYFPPKSIKKYKFDPYASVKFGGSHLREEVKQNGGSISASDNSFAWALGGGGDYQFNSQWFGRVGLDFLRTHFVQSGQSRLRLVIGVGYTFGPRPTVK